MSPGDLGLAVNPGQGNLLIANLDALRVVGQVLAFFGTENETSPGVVEVAGDEVFIAEGGEDIVEFGVGGFLEGGNALKVLDVYKSKCFYVAFDIPLRWTGALENARLVVERNSACAARCRRREQRVQTEFILCCNIYQNTQVIRCCRRLSPRRSSHLTPALSWQAPPRRLNFGRHLHAAAIPFGRGEHLTTFIHQPPCRYLHIRRGLWPASSKLCDNAAPSVNTSRLVPTPPPPAPARCNTLLCRLATLCLPRVSERVRPLNRTV